MPDIQWVCVSIEKRENRDLKQERLKLTGASAVMSLSIAGMIGMFAHAYHKDKNYWMLQNEKESSESSVEELEDGLDCNRTSYRAIAGEILIDNDGHEKYLILDNEPLSCEELGGVVCSVDSAADLVTCVDKGE